jgi:hypothetical protein
MVFYRGWESKREEFKGSSHWYKLRLFIKIVQRTMWGKKDTYAIDNSLHSTIKYCCTEKKLYTFRYSHIYDGTLLDKMDLMAENNT